MNEKEIKQQAFVAAVLYYFQTRNLTLNDTTGYHEQLAAEYAEGMSRLAVRAAQIQGTWK